MLCISRTHLFVIIRMQIFMSTSTPTVDRQSSINAGIDSTFRDDPAHRGSLHPTELDSIHQTASFKQAKQLEKEDNQELAAKLKQFERAKQSTK